MSELRPVPTDPAGLKEWIANLSKDELMALTQQVASGALTGHLGRLGKLGERNREIDLAPPPEEPSLLTLTIELRGSKPRIWRRARAVADRPRELVASVLERLPLGKGFEAQAGWFLLLGLAAGESGGTLDIGMAQILTDLGWRTHSSPGLSASDARHGARSTLDALGVNGRRTPGHRHRTRHPIGPSHPAGRHQHPVRPPILGAGPPPASRPRREAAADDRVVGLRGRSPARIRGSGAEPR